MRDSWRFVSYTRTRSTDWIQSSILAKVFARARSTVRCEILLNGSISAALNFLIAEDYTQTSRFSSSCIVEKARLDAAIGAQQQRQHLITVHAPAHTKNDKGDICLLSRVPATLYLLVRVCRTYMQCFSQCSTTSVTPHTQTCHELSIVVPLGSSPGPFWQQHGL